MKSKIEQSKLWIPEVIFGLIVIALVVRLFRLSLPEMQDFEVYWKAAHAWAAGNSPYHFTAEDKGFVFKYPPWILPLFLPFAFLDFYTSKIIWTTLQVFAMAYSMWWLVRAGVHRRIVFFVSLLFWWMFLAHAYFGQFTIFLLMTALWACRITPEETTDSKRVAFLSYIFSAKVFSMVSLFGLFRWLVQPLTLIYGLLLLISSHCIVLITDPNRSLRQSGDKLVQLYRDWAVAASSGGAELGAKIVRGQNNHGLTTAVLRWLNVDAKCVQCDMITAIGLAFLFGFLWWRYSKLLTLKEKWTGWLAIGLITHPLAWHHSFVMAFPFCTFSLNRAIQSKSRTLMFCAFFGIACIGLFIPQVIGVDAVKPLEYLANKSWGVVICGIVMIVASRKTQV